MTFLDVKKGSIVVFLAPISVAGIVINGSNVQSVHNRLNNGYLVVRSHRPELRAYQKT